MKIVFLLTYILVLVTQLPHVWFAYSSLEQPGFSLAHVTAIGAAIAFETATGIFTLRIVQGSKRRWTRPGLAFFIAASVVANGYYYGWWRWLFDWLMPVFATLALPLALALFAEEFGAEVKREQRQTQRAERQSEQANAVADPIGIVADPLPNEPATLYICAHPGCGRTFATQQALAGHRKAHTNGHAPQGERMPALESES